MLSKVGLSQMEEEIVSGLQTLEFSISLCYLCGQEQCSCCDVVSVELGETVEHVETLHVHYRRVDA